MSKRKSKESKSTPEEKPLEETNIPMVDHVVTQEDLDNNPELVGQLNIGDVIQIPADEAEKPLEEPVIEDQSSEVSEEPKIEEPEAEEPQAEEDTKVEEKPLEEENKASEEEPELVAPRWCDPVLWNSLSKERKQQLIRGENFRE